jgi:outer membrane protein assembly factor BamA
VKFPDKFYGIGNKSLEEDEEDYTAQTFIFELSFQREIITGLNVGLLYEYVDSKMKEVEEDGFLAKKNISGSEGGKVSGIGVVMDWDTRDNIFYPSTGAFYQMSVRGYGDNLGSDFSFNKYTLDFRQFFPLFSRHVVGFQGYVSMKTGNPPFQMMSLLGGENIMRGYYLGRYRDKNMIVFQTEYRVVPVLWRFGLVAFLGLGEVNNEFSNFRLKDFKYSLGWGIRYQFNKDEGFNIRLDFGLGKDTSGLYINFLEAF